MWHPQQDSQRSDVHVVAAYTGVSTHRTGSTMTTGMTITISIKIITIGDNSCHRSSCEETLIEALQMLTIITRVNTEYILLNK